MLTYELTKAPGIPLYESLYRCIRKDIQTGKLLPGEKLPSKRTLSANLKVSKITVENAYNQLLSEGYIRSEEKVGYFVEEVERILPAPEPERETQNPQENPIDLTANNPVKFPFSVWSRLHRQVLLDLGHNLLQPVPNQGLSDLRRAIARHLAQFRGMQVRPEQIFIGAGTDFLYNLLIQLLGRDKCYAVEEPGYGKIRKIYAAAGAGCMTAMMDAQGVCPEELAGADVLHISPSHHFPTGLVTPLSRRQELLAWAKAGVERWIIEDDYDSEFRFASRPMPAMQSLDGSRVVYMNTFSKTLAPSIRISYMVLPMQLMEKLQQKLGFYSCTVPSFEQHTLARFLDEGHFEKHINRMRKFYKARRNRLLAAVANCPVTDKLSILEENAGLHFLVRVHSYMTDPELEEYCRKMGIRVRSLSSYYAQSVPEWAERCLVVNYSGLTEQQMQRLETCLAQLPFEE
jgi:GntR family transcriptional regulator/MocR family aminotransferase